MPPRVEPIQYRSDRQITAEQFTGVLIRSTLGERRPVRDRERMAAMVEKADLICTAWAGDLLVGVARSLTDFVYCCYLSDLAVDVAYQRRGIGLELIRLTQRSLHPEATLILLAAPKAREYYPRIGMNQHPSAWTIGAGAPLRLLKAEVKARPIGLAKGEFVVPDDFNSSHSIEVIGENNQKPPSL